MTFEAFWSLYPRKVKKFYAQKCWEKLKLSPADTDQIERMLTVYINCEWVDRPKDKIPHPSTFLNERYWQDDEVEAREDDHEPESKAEAIIRRQLEHTRGFSESLYRAIGDRTEDGSAATADSDVRRGPLRLKF